MKIDIEKYNQIIDEVYENYLKNTMFDSNPKWLNPVPVMNMRTGEKSMGAKQYTKDEFISKIKTDGEFAKNWGLKIEKKEYTLVNGEFIKEINVYHIPKTSTEYIETKFIVLPTGDIENE